MSADGEFSRPSVGTAAARATRSMPPAGPCPPASTCSTTSRRTDWTPCSPTTPRSRSRSVYQPMIVAYRHENRRHGRELMARLIDSISTGVPKALVEITKLGRTLKKRAADVLAYFDRPGTSNGPTEAINGRLEHLRGSALGFRNLTNYIARSLLESGGFKPRLHPRL